MRAGEAKVELLTSDPSGTALQVIAGGGRGALPIPFPYSPPSWSADGSRVAFTGISGGRGLSDISVYTTTADGSGLTKVPGTRGAVYPLLSPDGQSLAFARYRERRGPRGALKFQAAAVTLVKVNGETPRRLTPWRNGLEAFPSSFSPDGSTLAISQERKTPSGSPRFAAIAIRLDGSGATVLARQATQPVYSPDGGQLALISVGKRKTKRKTFEDGEVRVTYNETELAVANADGTGLRKLTGTHGLEFLPSWDPSGQRLAYTYLPIDPFDFLERGSSIMAINGDGSCRTRVLSYPNAFAFGAVWQPGAGREAGRIAC
jgi:Tol biopolymer transport system component